MLTEPKRVPGVAGTVVVNTDRVLGRHVVLIDGTPAVKAGRNKYDLPAPDGSTVRAKLKVTAAQPYPALVIGGEPHRLGPKSPRYLAILTALPLLGFVGALVGGAIGLCGLAVNLVIARSDLSRALKAALMVAVFIATMTVLVLVFAGVNGGS